MFDINMYEYGYGKKCYHPEKHMIMTMIFRTSDWSLWKTLKIKKQYRETDFIYHTKETRMIVLYINSINFLIQTFLIFSILAKLYTRKKSYFFKLINGVGMIQTVVFHGYKRNLWKSSPTPQNIYIKEIYVF